MGEGWEINIPSNPPCPPPKSNLRALWAPADEIHCVCGGGRGGGLYCKRTRVQFWGQPTCGGFALTLVLLGAGGRSALLLRVIPSLGLGWLNTNLQLAGVLLML